MKIKCDSLLKFYIELHLISQLGNINRHSYYNIKHKSTQNVRRLEWLFSAKK